MQLSSRTKDYVVDTLALRKQLGPALIGIFANPEIVKVNLGSLLSFDLCAVAAA